ARGTFMDIYYFLTNEEAKRKILSRVSQPDIHKYWAPDGEYSRLRGHPETPITSRMAKFLLRPAIKAILDANPAKLNFGKIIAENKILIINLKNAGPQAGNILGSLAISQLQQAIWRRKRDDRDPYYLYVDEFQHFQTKAF